MSVQFWNLCLGTYLQSSHLHTGQIRLLRPLQLVLFRRHRRYQLHIHLHQQVVDLCLWCLDNIQHARLSEFCISPLLETVYVIKSPARRTFL